MSTILSPRVLGDVNRSRVLQTLVDHGPLSRAELARLAQVTRATIGNIVGSLLDTGVLEEQELREGQVGKPARPLWFAPRGALSAVASFEDTGVEAALVSATGAVLARHQVGYGGTAPGQARLRSATAEALDAVVAGATPMGVGVAVPAMCSSTGEVVVSSVLPALEGSWLRDLLTSRYGVPVVVDTDARSQALAEKWFGQGRGVRAFAAVRIGSGLGAGVVVNGTVFRADQGIGGEFGHTVVQQRGGLPCACGRSGCWETVAGTAWLHREAAARGLGGTVDCASLVARDDTAGLLADYADNVAVGLANLVHVYHPQLLVLNGDVTAGGEPLRAAVDTALRERLVPIVRADVRVVLSALGADATLLGAAALVLSDRFSLAV